jgi:enoyl-CoA hydratase/carnithine racemase
MATQHLEQDNEVFETKQYEGIVYLSLKEVPLLWLSNLEKKDILLSYFDQIESVPSIKVVILHEPNSSLDQQKYFELHDWWAQSKIDTNALQRIYRALDQTMLRIIDSDKVYISVQSGKVILPFFTLNFASDYRIVADNLIVQNPAPKIGLIPKSAGAFFLTRILGAAKTEEILLSSKELSAYELFRMKLVDKVVSFNKLRYVALETAKTYSTKSGTSLSGVKRLVNYSLKDLKDYLEFEDEQLLKILNTRKS